MSELSKRLVKNCARQCSLSDYFKHGTKMQNDSTSQNNILFSHNNMSVTKKPMAAVTPQSVVFHSDLKEKSSTSVEDRNNVPSFSKGSLKQRRLLLADSDDEDAPLSIPVRKRKLRIDSSSEEEFHPLKGKDMESTFIRPKNSSGDEVEIILNENDTRNENDESQKHQSSRKTFSFTSFKKQCLASVEMSISQAINECISPVKDEANIQQVKLSVKRSHAEAHDTCSTSSNAVVSSSSHVRVPQPISSSFNLDDVFDEFQVFDNFDSQTLKPASVSKTKQQTASQTSVSKSQSSCPGTSTKNTPLNLDIHPKNISSSGNSSALPSTSDSDLLALKPEDIFDPCPFDYDDFEEDLNKDVNASVSEKQSVHAPSEMVTYYSASGISSASKGSPVKSRTSSSSTFANGFTFKRNLGTSFRTQTRLVKPIDKITDSAQESPEPILLSDAAVASHCKLIPPVPSCRKVVSLQPKSSSSLADSAQNCSATKVTPSKVLVADAISNSFHLSNNSEIFSMPGTPITSRCTHGGLTVDQILKHPVFRVSKLEPEDCGVLHSLQESLRELITSLFLTLPLSKLKDYLSDVYDCKYHEQLLAAHAKIQEAIASYTVEGLLTSNASITATPSTRKPIDSLRSEAQLLKSSPKKLRLEENIKIPTSCQMENTANIYDDSHSFLDKRSYSVRHAGDNNYNSSDNAIAAVSASNFSSNVSGDNKMNLPGAGILSDSSCDSRFGNFEDDIPLTSRIRPVTNPSAECVLVDSQRVILANSSSQPLFRDHTSTLPVKDFSGINYPHSKLMAKMFKEQFGLRSFRPNQKEVINAALLGHDVFVLMPTGGGKSLCYQLPACVNNGLTIVVSPLKSLIQDQLQKLHSLDISAATLSGNMPASEENAIYLELMKREPGFKLLYVTPEKINASARFMSLLEALYKRKQLARFVIDEVHCVSQWGHDFRPDYKKLSIFREKFPCVPVMGLTATATPRIRTDIMVQLKVDEQNMRLFKNSFNRVNLHYEVLVKKGKNIVKEVSELIQSRYKGQCGIVYCLSRNECDGVAAELKELKISAMSYHAGMSDQQRAKVQEMWVNDKYKVIVATIAFGMGIDKPDVRFVIHYSLPKSVEGYYQESGRAGRDGEPATCSLFYSYNDVHRIHKMIDQDNENNTVKETHLNNLYRMVGYCMNRTDCRRTAILAYFGEHINRDICSSSPISSCDNCKSQEVFTDVEVTNEAQQIVSAVRQICSGGRWANNFTLNYFVNIFRGSAIRKIIDNGHNRLTMYGTGKSWSRTDSERLLHMLVLRRFLTEQFVTTRDGIINAYVRVGEEADKLFQKNAKIVLKMPTKTETKKKTSVSTLSAAGIEDSDEEMKSLQQQCYDSLLSEVKTIAEENSLHYINVINMVALRIMSRQMPESEEEMRSIPHITQANFHKYGQRLLDITQRFAANKLVLLSERACDLDFEDESLPSGAEEEATSNDWLNEFKAPSAAYMSNSFNINHSRRAARGGFRGRKFARGRKKIKNVRASAQSHGSSETYQVRVARQVNARRKSAAAAVLRAAKNTASTRGTSKLSLMSVPKPRSFLPPPKVYEM